MYEEGAERSPGHDTDIDLVLLDRRMISVEFADSLEIRRGSVKSTRNLEQFRIVCSRRFARPVLG